MVARKQIDSDKVEELAAQGLSTTQIALCMGVARSTLYERMKADQDVSDAIDRGRAKGLQQVANALFQNAMKGNYQAQQFYLRNRDPERWKDRTEQVVDNRSLKEMSDAEIAQALKEVKAA